VAGDSATYEWYFPGALNPVSTDQYPQVVYTTVGSFDVRLIVHDAGRVDSITKTGFIQTTISSSGTLAENFESGRFDASWNLKGGPNGNCGWVVTSTAGGFGNSSFSMIYDNYNYDAVGARDEIWTSKCDLTSATSGYLNFEVAYSNYGFPYSDTLEVFATTDCGQTFSLLYRKGGQQLATAPSITSAGFVPTATQWRKDSVDITNFVGSNEVIFAFVNIGRFGQNLYVDNIELETVLNVGVPIPVEWTTRLFPNPFQEQLHVELDRELTGTVILYDAVSHPVLKASLQKSIDLDVRGLAAGVYIYEIRTKDGMIRSGRLIKN
jgi:PKD repeat protein